MEYDLDDVCSMIEGLEVDVREAMCVNPVARYRELLRKRAEYLGEDQPPRRAPREED